MIQQSTTSNGIRILTERIPQAHSISVGFWVEVGSRHEATHQSGLSHLAEHMLFKGTQTRSSQDISMAMDMIGGVLNAFTSREYTCYYAKVLKDKADCALELLSDIFLNSLFCPDELEREQRVILQEIRMIEDTPDDAIHDLALTEMYPDSSLGKPVIGSADSVAAISRDDLLSFIDTHYCGRRLVIAAAGALDHAAFVADVEQQMAGLNAGRDQVAQTAPQVQTGLAVIGRDLEQAHFCVSVPALHQSHPDRFAVHLLNLVLGGSMSSRLFQEVREKRGLCYSIYSYLNMHADVGNLTIYAGANADDVCAILQVIREQFQSLRDAGVLQEEFVAAREQLKGNLLLSLESTDNRMSRLAKNELLLGQQTSIEEVVHQIDQVRPETLDRLANELLCDQRISGTVLGPVEHYKEQIQQIFTPSLR